jgi:ABC-type transporter Mla subunit MlaD
MIKIILIILLILSFLYIINNDKIIEGADDGFQEYKETRNDPLFLATKNAANIQVLRDNMQKFNSIRDQFDQIKQNVTANTKGIQNLSDQITQFSQSLTANDDNKDKDK